MAENPITVPLPADLPTNWVYGQTVAPDGSDVGLSQQHGYNYLMEQVNAAQQAAEELGEAFSGLASLDGTGKVPADELPDLDYDPAGSAAAVKEDLEEKLNGKVSIDGIIFDTLNNATTPGRFTVQVPWDSEGLPFPTTADGGFVWGILDVYEQALSGRFILQIFSPITTTNDLYYRKNINSSGWTKWEKIATFPSDLGTAGARAISAGTTDLTAGSSALATGQIYLVYG